MFFLCWNVSLLSMTNKALDDQYWFEKVCFEYGTNGFCNKHVLIVKRLNVVHNSQSQGTSVLVWKGLLGIWNQLFLQQPSSDGETSQCCPWHPKPMIIGTDLKSLLRIWNQPFLQQLFSCGETSQCCPWQPKPRNIGAALKRSASNLKPTVSAATAFL